MGAVHCRFVFSLLLHACEIIGYYYIILWQLGSIVYISVGAVSNVNHHSWVLGDIQVVPSEV